MVSKAKIRKTPADAKKKFYSENRATEIDSISRSYEQIIKILKDLEVRSFLDIGCGDGSFASAVRDVCHCEVSGVEISSQSVREAKERGIDAQVIDLDQSDLPFSDQSFDCVFCGYIIEHLYSPDHMMEEVRRVLRPGGKIIVTTANLASWFNRLSLLFGYQPIFSDVSLKYSFGHLWKLAPMGHLRLYTYRSLRRLVEIYGFKIVHALGIGINDRIGFGKSHPALTKVANFIFRSPAYSSHLIVVGQKDD